MLLNLKHYEALAEKPGKNKVTVSRWCTNEMQPSLESLVEIADTLRVDVRLLLYYINAKE